MPHIVDDDDALLDEMDDDLLSEDDAPEPAEPEASSLESVEVKTPPSKEVSEDDEDDTPYGKRVQKRIGKLTAKMREMERETQQWKERVTELETKTKAKEIAEFQSQVEWSASELNKQIDAARAAKKTAMEEGDIDQQIKIDEQILELREQLAEKKRMASAAKEQATQFHEQATKAPPQATIPDHLPAGTKQWLRANPWFMKGSDARAVEFAKTLDAALQDEGYSPDDAAMYAELDKRLQVLVPRLAKTAAKPPAKPRVMGSSADGQRPDSATKPQRRITSDDVSKMRRYGFNPDKAEDRKHWLRRNDPL